MCSFFPKRRQLEVLSSWPVRTRRMLGYVAVHRSTTLYTAFHCNMYCGKNYKRELLARGHTSAGRTLVSKRSLVSLHHPQSRWYVHPWPGFTLGLCGVPTLCEFSWEDTHFWFRSFRGCNHCSSYPESTVLFVTNWNKDPGHHFCCFHLKGEGLDLKGRV